MVLTVLLAAGLLCVLVAGVMTTINLCLYRRAPRPADSMRGPETLVSVCVPARNEENNLESCVRSLLRGTHADIEVLIYNDQSTDRTGEIAQRLAHENPRVRVVPTEPLPPGWNGKQWGCAQMARLARGEWLVFTDADVRFERDAIERALLAATALNADLISTFPRQITGSLGEALVIPLIHFILLSYLPIPRMRRTTSPAASAGCGQFLLVRRVAYTDAGTHAAFKSSLHDGIMLPRTLRRAGFRTDLFDGTDVCSVRMYRGLAQTWNGFAKNAYEGLGSVTLLVFITIIHALGHMLPPAVLLAGVLGAPTGRDAMVLAGVCTALTLTHRLVLAVRFRQSLVSALLHPVGIALMTGVQWWSLVLTLRGQRVWRGRGA